MNVFEHLITKFRTLQVEQVVQPAIDGETLKFIEELNKEQLQNSQNLDGDTFRQYSQITVDRYNNKRTTKVSSGENIKLKDTGKLYDSIRAEVDKNGISLSAQYNKQLLDFLEEDLGKFIGLTKENKEYVSTKLVSRVVLEIKNKLLNK